MMGMKSKSTLSNSSQVVDREIVERLLLGAAPERAADLRGMWSKYDPTFLINRDCPLLVFTAKKDRIGFSHKTLRHDWVLGFAGWKAFRCYSPAIVAAALTGAPLDPVALDMDNGLPAEEAVFEELVYTAQLLARAATADEVPWPAAIPEPVADGSSLSLEDRAAFELLCIATAASFMHEMSHIRFAQEQKRFDSSPEEERKCDEVARKFILEGASEYGRSAGWAVERVLTKRTMGLALAAYIIHETTPSASRGGSDSHPSSADRFEEFVGEATAADDSDCWVFAASLLLAAIRRARRFTHQVDFESPKNLCAKLIRLLREAHP